jgi:hypothetical protein
VNFNTSCTNRVTVVNVVGLSGYNTTTPIAQSPTNSGNSASATATLTSPKTGNGEVAFLGVRGGVVTVTRPSGFSQVFFNSGSQGGSYNAGSYFNPQASASSTFTVFGRPHMGNDRLGDQPRVTPNSRWSMAVAVVGVAAPPT